MARKPKFEKGALDLLEEAVHLLRVAPASTLLCYYIGALPFTLGFLFFWADMSRSAFAYQHCARAAFGLALLFIWMKTWQSIFAAKLLEQISAQTARRFTVARFLRIAASQFILQPSGFFILPLAALIALPFAWVFAFYQNATALGATETSNLFRRSSRLATTFPKQNHIGILVLCGFGFFVWLNIITLLAFLPNLLKTFLGIETVFTLGGIHAYLNTTFISACFAVTYLCVDPLVKSFYALRCFYGESITSGEDLKAEFRSQIAPATALVLLFCCLISFPQKLAAAESSSSKTVPATTVPAGELNQAIEKVSARPEFAWRLPREKGDSTTKEKNWFVLFVESAFETVMHWMRTLRDWVRDFVDWLAKFLRPKHSNEESHSDSGSWMQTLRWLVFALIALVASALAILFLRMWKRREKRSLVIAEAVPLTPDLNDENVSANQLPEDGWLKLARELMEQGDLRLALRALYLAGLAHLAEREFLTIAKFKSNREYEHELRRRARALPELQGAFGQNVSAFDRTWYGMHEVTRETLEGFQSNLERIRAA